MNLHAEYTISSKLFRLETICFYTFHVCLILLHKSLLTEDPFKYGIFNINNYIFKARNVAQGYNAFLAFTKPWIPTPPLTNMYILSLKLPSTHSSIYLPPGGAFLPAALLL